LSIYQSLGKEVKLLERSRVGGIDRRTFVKGLVTLGIFGSGLLAYSPVIDKIVRPKYIADEIPPDPQLGENVRYVYSVCLGCNVRCGIRVRVVNIDGIEVIERIEGNPYHPYNRAVSIEKQSKIYSALPYRTPIDEATRKWFGTLCPRGQDGIHYIYDPYRVIKPLKRAGPRGSGRWKVISWEQLIREITEGGVIEETGEKLPGLKDFFVYGILKSAGFEDPNKILSDMKKDVDAIMKIARDPDKTYNDLVKALGEFKEKWEKILSEKGLSLKDILIDPDRPDLGTRANMIVWMRGRGQDNADTFYRRFIYSLGSVNWLRHTSSCQLGYYAGNYLWSGTYDLQGDIMGARVIIFAGAAMGRLHPGATGQGILIERAADGDVKIYYVNPSSPRVANKNIIWVPIKPGEDAALAMGMIRWIIENKRYNRDFLQIPNLDAASKKGYPVVSNATWLVIADEGHPSFGEFLKDTHVGIGDKGVPLVISGGVLKPHTDVDSAEIDWEGKVTLKTGESVTVKTAFRILREEAMSRSLEEWASICGVPVNLIVQMARDFVDAAPYSSTVVHRGVGMHPSGEYMTWAYRMLDTLVGNFHRVGGILGRPSTTSYNDKIYNCGISGFGEPIRWGPPIDRHGYMYEDTLEYWVRVKRGENPYPARRPWYPLTPEESYTELFAGISEGYPYRIGALILYYANPVLASNYGIKFVEVLRDREKIPLYIAITTTINESMIYADYIVPDTTYLETGTNGVQFLYASGAGVMLAEGWRSPAILPLTQHIGRCPNGHDRYASMWEFVIDVGKALGAPGYGDKGIPGTRGAKYEGKWFSLHCFWEYILRVFANAAIDALGRGIIPKDIPSEDIDFVVKNYPISRYRDIIPEDEWRYVAYGLARGGVFTRYEDSFDANGISRRSVPGDRVLKMWNEKLAKARNSITGEKFWGGPRYFPQATYAPIAGIRFEKPAIKGLHGVALRELYREYPYTLIFETGPLFTKHRSQFYYWIKAIMPENFAVINPMDAEKLGIETGDVVKIETPTGSIEVPVVVEPTVREGVILVPYGMGRWADTVVMKPRYLAEIRDDSVRRILSDLPDRVEIPEEAVNPVKGLPRLVKKILFTKSPAEYYEKGLAPDKWRFNGVTPNPVEISDPSLGNWPLLSWIGASQAYYDTPARIIKTGVKHRFEVANIVR
jgi:anaerobic selenocysteine-containing dehydrogenase